MVKKAWLILSLVAAFNCKAEDTTRILNHELGFNAVSLLQQLRIFTVTPGQQPYDVFYNIYYKDKIGLRFGAGLLSEETLTQIEGQQLPRTTKFRKQHLRGGVSCNVLLTKRLAFNVFFDGFLFENSTSSSNTFTTQVFPDPIVTRTVKSTDEAFGGGVQGGFGVKFNFTKHLSLYTEVPLTYTKESHLVEDVISESGEPDIESRSLTTVSGTRIALPVSIYLVLRF